MVYTNNVKGGMVMKNEEFAKTQAGKVWEVFKQNGHVCYADWLVEEMARLDRAQSAKREEPEME